jgi:hypothetical protein
MDVPETRYAKTADGVHVAYQVRGDSQSTWHVHLVSLAVSRS